MLGSGDKALNKVGKVAAPLELPFILVMETGDGKATRQGRWLRIGVRAVEESVV